MDRLYALIREFEQSEHLTHSCENNSMFKISFFSQQKLNVQNFASVK